MKNAVIWGFDHASTYPALEELERRGVIRIKAWVGENTCPRCTHNIHDFYQGTFPYKRYSGYGTEIYGEVYASLYTFMDMFTRRNFPFNDKPISEFLNMFNLFFDYFCELIVEEQIEVLIFANIPHEGPDLILYKIAKAMGLKTLMFYQTLFANKFFYLHNPEDLGEFREIPALSDPGNIKLEKKFEKKLFYMSSVSTKRALPQIPVAKLKQGIGKLNRATLQSERLMELALQRGQWYRINKEYRKSLSRYCQAEVDLKAKYVYFPLHLQPELTTSALGGIYADQLLAIERLSKILPEDWSIYVKENPKQNGFMRGDWFFARLAKVPKVKFVSMRVNTYLLLENCVFVATITGTAGWEAISGGKNALVFGQAWYKSLPGVFSFDDNFSLDKILTYQINHQELEKRLNVLLTKTGDGVIDPAYITIVEDFNVEKNTQTVSKLLAKLI